MGVHSSIRHHHREPRVVALNDASFEHLTQASTGATTGDWLVMFHGLSCDRCEALESRLQGVAAKLRNRVMVAKVSSETDGRETAKRFGVAPTQMTILFFRQGVVYTYDVSRLDLTSLSAFAVGLYKDAPSRPVPELPQTPLMLALQVVAGVAVVAYILMLIVSKQREAAQKKKGF
ncbi:thioredoxin domain-containing protein-like [Pollicipes pollicipes]|uniref:thioredoxin domain-containing protein-like n=1 Tax=Pollicipes pollicipes TaxID=41117 RepID=UPI0018856B13|nr:thioredoxin domain-containing protein-like [Pollicipes pollicipes]